MCCIAIIDTETNWSDQVMSIGTVIADRNTLEVVYTLYQILTPEYLTGGMFSDTLLIPGQTNPQPQSRIEAISQLRKLLCYADVNEIFAYNAAFDRGHLPELSDLKWFDIMRLAAYRQYNPYIPQTADLCATGRLKRGYGVEAMLRLLSGKNAYCESHNALQDALDELKIMRLLGHPVQEYIPL